MGDKLRLRAADCEDLAVISACLQDARIPLKETVFLPNEHRFMAAFLRYRRERQPGWDVCEGLTETSSALTFENVQEVKYRGLDPADLDRRLELLTIATAPGHRDVILVDLIFSGDAVIQLRTPAIQARLEDFGEAVACRMTPCDHFAASMPGWTTPHAETP